MLLQYIPTTLFTHPLLSLSKSTLKRKT